MSGHPLQRWGRFAFCALALALLVLIIWTAWRLTQRSETRALWSLLLALTFWTLGTVVLVYSLPGKREILFFVFCQATSATLAMDALSAFGPLWTAPLSGLLLWWLGPVAIHFHLHFPTPTPRRYSSRLMILSYGIATLGSVLSLVIDPLVQGHNLLPLYAIRRFWLAICLLGALLLLAYAHRRTASFEMRRQVGLVAVGVGMPLALFLTLSLLPGVLLRQPLVPYRFAHLLLPAAPLAYAFALLRHRFTNVERYIRRGVAYFMVLLMLSGLYLILHAALARLLSFKLWQRPTAHLALALASVIVSGPLYRRLQVVVNRLLYGGWYDYRSAVQELSQVLGRAADSATLAETLSQGIRKAMKLECACLLLPNERQDLVCQSCAAHHLCRRCLYGQGGIGQHFQRQPEVIETPMLREALDGLDLSAAEAQLLACQRARLWIPLTTHNRCLGILIVGAKRSGEPFDKSDLEILEVVIRQASIALENAYLAAELQQRALESERLHRQVLRAREEERKRIARELHDQIIQALVGLNYHLAGIKNHPVPGQNGHVTQLQTQVRGILGDVRRICADLRPPALDSLGLIPAARSRLREVDDQAPFRIKLNVEGDAERDLPEDIALCVYRALQEALLNVQKHAEARQVKVNLQIDLKEVRLRVEDDGQGFVVPRRLGQLTSHGHFGLVGLRERLELVNGTFEVASTPGRGCRLEVRVPLNVH